MIEPTASPDATPTQPSGTGTAPIHTVPLRQASRWRKVARVVWTVLSAFAVQSIIFGLAVLPAATFWEWHFRWRLPTNWLRIVVLSMSFVPAYVLFAIALMALSAGAMRLLRWRTPANAEMRITDLDWPLLNWARYAISTHLVRVFAGTIFRATPLWGFYLKMNGARIGRAVFINALSVYDHNLLSFGDHAVVGSDTHLSGHLVEAGMVKTAPIRVGCNVTIGIGTVVSVGVEIGDNTQVGALSVLLKHQKLEPNAVYAGAPARRIDKNERTFSADPK